MNYAKEVREKVREDTELDEDFEAAMEEINEMIENAPSNTLILCRMGGVSALLSLLCTSKCLDVKLRAVRLFAMITRNNKKVQQYAARSGAINLAVLLERETEPKMIELLLAAMNSFITADNFDAKRQYILDMDGLDQLSRWIAVDGEEAQKLHYKKASKNVVRSMRLKLLQILNDLLLNDSSITKTNLSKRNDYVKKYLMADTKLMDHLIGLIGPDVDLSVTKDGVVRSQYVLNILFRLYENNSTDDKDMFVKMAKAVQNHKERLIDYMLENPDKAERL